MAYVCRELPSLTPERAKDVEDAIRGEYGGERVYIATGSAIHRRIQAGEDKTKGAKRVLIAAHGNSLRSLVLKLEHLTPEEILKVNIPTGVPLVYTFDTDFNVLDKRYIGDPATIAAKIDAVANQGKAHK